METETRAVVRCFWDRESVTPTAVTWMAHPKVREYINAAISGEEGLWPVDWLMTIVRGRVFRKGLSIGCGTGPLERDLVKRGLVLEFDAVDGSPVSVERARQLADEEGLSSRIHYRVDDFNELQLSDQRYDVVVFHQSAHHVAKLEKLYRRILRALAEDGLVYMDEYVGPSRSEWSDATVSLHRERYERIPRHARHFDVLPLPIQPEDPSEAIRSSEIVPQLSVGFRILNRRDYGGNLLSVLFAQIDWPAAPSHLLEDLVRDEKRLLAAGEPSYYCVLLAEAKRPRMWSRMRYFVEPKLRRVWREWRRITGIST